MTVEELIERLRCGVEDGSIPAKAQVASDYGTIYNGMDVIEIEHYPDGSALVWIVLPEWG